MPRACGVAPRASKSPDEFSDHADKFVYVLLGRVERAHQAHLRALLVPDVEEESLLYPSDALARDDGEDGVRLDRLRDFNLRDLSEFVGEQSGHSVRVRRVLEPEVFREERVELRGDEAHLRWKLRPLLAHELEVACERRVEEDDGLAVHHPVLRSSETQNVNARPRRQLSQRDAEVRRSVREPRAVNVQKYPARVRERGEAREFLDRVDRPQLRRLRDGDYARLYVVLVARAC